MVKVVVPEPEELDWEGEWNAVTSYVRGDVVYRDGSSYRARVAHAGQDPLDSPEQWEFVAKKGAQGPQGQQGATGLPGTGAAIIVPIDTPAAVWQHAHGYGTYPSIVTLDSTGRRVYGQEEYLDTDTVRVTFSSALGGRMILTF